MICSWYSLKLNFLLILILQGGGASSLYQPQQPFYPQEQPSILLASLEQYQGTIFPTPNFNAEADCQALSQAMKGAGKLKIEKKRSNFDYIILLFSGTNERALIDIIVNRSNSQRQQIKLQYKSMYGVVCILIEIE